ncbi:hypothetical protein DFA_12265 [Cavenderia fasciculata]|uniref:Integrase zinc-binding domain-containing protein n=1 Tax=Cavenderia fasciculata TaxID=261658 RepID=F4QCW6_CACFS|nr:uncharacterized protein DFA_12265 [Cavenderia fasciculata]EGG14490.1 hypothetical protein DFA_12265 [Cavenderia fasciculata]|eukprot:XP_004353899.1 hypothetical protein DFA_12265 [Cavenderia fasciculata]
MSSMDKTKKESIYLQSMLVDQLKEEIQVYVEKMSARFLSVFRNTVDLEFEHWDAFREAFLTVFASDSTDLAVMNRVLTQFRYDTKWTVSSFTNAFTIIAGRVYENNDNRSFVLAPSIRNYKKEPWILKTNYYHLVGRDITVFTDHKNIPFINENMKIGINQRLNRWMEVIRGFQPKLLHIKGTDNVIADGLSRNTFTTQIVSPTLEDNLLKEMINGYEEENIAIRNKTLAPCSATYIVDQFGLRRHLGKIVVPRIAPIINQVLYRYHDSVWAGHSSPKKTLDAIKSKFFWMGMREEILDHCNQCIVCKRGSDHRDKRIGLLQPLQPPNYCFQRVHIDVITGLPNAKYHGKTVNALVNVQHQSNGQVERMIRTIENIIRKDLLQSSAENHKISWAECIDNIEFAINNTVHSTTVYSPFTIYLGSNPLSPLNLLDTFTPNFNDNTDIKITENHKLKEIIRDIVIKRINEGNAINKAKYDHNKVENNIKSGDLVYVRRDRDTHINKTEPIYSGPLLVNGVDTRGNVEVKDYVAGADGSASKDLLVNPRFIKTLKPLLATSNPVHTEGAKNAQGNPVHTEGAENAQGYPVHTEGAENVQGYPVHTEGAQGARDNLDGRVGDDRTLYQDLNKIQSTLQGQGVTGGDQGIVSQAPGDIYDDVPNTADWTKQRVVLNDTLKKVEESIGKGKSKLQDKDNNRIIEKEDIVITNYNISKINYDDTKINFKELLHQYRQQLSSPTTTKYFNMKEMNSIRIIQSLQQNNNDSPTKDIVNSIGVITSRAWLKPLFIVKSKRTFKYQGNGRSRTEYLININDCEVWMPNDLVNQQHVRAVSKTQQVSLAIVSTELKFNVRVVGIGSRSALLELVDVCNRSNVQLQPNTFYMVKVFGINGYKTLYSSYFNFTPNNVNITGLKAYQYDNSQFVIEYASRQNNNSQTFYTVLVNDTIYCQQDTTPKPCFVVTSLPDSIDQQTITLNTTILKVLKPQQTLAITSSSSSSSLSCTITFIIALIIIVLLF